MDFMAGALFCFVFEQNISLIFGEDGEKRDGIAEQNSNLTLFKLELLVYYIMFRV